MSESKHTRGPWFLINEHCVGGPMEPGWEEAGCGIAHCGMRARTPEEAAANARLIAAAPDLVATLRAVRSWLDGQPTPQDWIFGHGTKEMATAIDAALAKAEAP